MVHINERPYQPADATAVAELFNGNDRQLGGRGGWMGEEIDAHLRTMIRDAGRDTRMLFDGDTLLAMAAVPAPPEGGFRVDATGAVRMDAQGRGFGRDLLAWQFDRAADLYRSTAPDRPWEVHATCAVGDGSAQRLYQRFGMTATRYWFEMVAPTANPSRPALAEGLRMAAYRPEFEAELYRAHMAAFADHFGYQARGQADWVALAVGSGTFLPELSRVAFDGDAVAGYVLSYRHPEADEVYIGQVGTVRAWRRRGVAGALLADVLAASDAAGRRRASLGVDADSPTGAVSIYERAGFETEFQAVTYTRAL